MKKWLSVVLTVAIVIPCICVAGATFDSEDSFFDNFNPSVIEYEIDIDPNEVFIEPTLTASNDSHTSDPRNAVSYDLKTGAIEIAEYSDYEDAAVKGTKESAIEDVVGIETYASGDTRTELTNVNSYRRVVFIKSYFRTSANKSVVKQGTGALISNTGILTAGHVVYDLDYGWAYKVEVTPGGPNSNVSTVTITNGTKLTSVEGWTINEDDEYDYAVIAIDDPFNVGYFGTRYYSTNSSLSKKNLYRYGYPGDKIEGTLWRATGQVDLIKANRFTYTGYAYGGESGGPVVFQDDAGIIVGIHTGHSNVNGTDYGGAVRMRKGIVDLIVEYGGATRN